MGEELTNEERAMILERELQTPLRQGWRILSRTETQAQLILPAKKKSGCLIVVLLVLGILPGILYLLWPSKDQIVVISVDVQGKVSREFGSA